MVEKHFKIFSNSSQHLTAESVSEALLHYFTLNPTKPNLVFGVSQVSSLKKEAKKTKIGTKV